MFDLRGFGANKVEPTGGFEPIPDGKYVAVIIGSEEKVTKSGKGSVLQLTFRIIEGPFTDRLIRAWLNLDNPNATAVKIACEQLAAICLAVDVPTPNSSLELHDLPLVIHVKCKKRDDTGEMVNEIKGYSKKEPPPPAAAGPAANSTPPWKRS